MYSVGTFISVIREWIKIDSFWYSYTSNVFASFFLICILASVPVLLLLQHQVNTNLNLCTRIDGGLS